MLLPLLTAALALALAIALGRSAKLRRQNETLRRDLSHRDRVIGDLLWDNFEQADALHEAAEAEAWDGVADEVVQWN